MRLFVWGVSVMNSHHKPAEPFFEIPYYHDYVSPALGRHLLSQAGSVPGVSGLIQVGPGGGLETTDALNFLVTLYDTIKSDLGLVLSRRIKDRKFIDERVKACYEYNQRFKRDINDPGYKTILGLEDADGRIVIGPRQAGYCDKGGHPVAPIPKFLQGPHVTLFGPPDSAKMAINAMNAYHRKLKGEPAVVEELLKTQNASPKWGADDEDSKTPLRQDLIEAAVNLTGCFDGTLSLKEAHKTYELAATNRSAPIKRFPGLALPATFMFYKENPIPLHLYDFALHMFKNWHNPESLTFYVPKLENEEEARYIHKMIATAEAMIKDIHPKYILGTVRVMIVLENPRAILRTHEIMDELYPYFVGASLGWHDYLGSTARLLKEDGNYRIPVKADPDIVIKYIKASHSMLADVVGSRGGIKVGGMYGILPQETDIESASFQVTLRGFFKDVITQLKRDLTGFWVAHPDFVRLGLAITEAWKLYAAGKQQPLFDLTKGIFIDKYRKEVDQFIRGDDIVGLDKTNPNYVRSLLVADIKESDYISGNHPDEIRYNVFQSLQYLTDWLSGNGCVALPTIINDIPVRIMDDLATAERSRWEVWHEIRHGRFQVEDFLKIAHEEMRFIRKDLSDAKKIVQVKWDDRTSKWYPVAFNIMIQLMTAESPVEFATELLMPFTVEQIRKAEDPWALALGLDPGKFHVTSYVRRWNYYFERCGTGRFAAELAKDTVLDLHKVETLIRGFTVDEMIEAASFHGDIGESPKTLDHQAKYEQKLVTDIESVAKSELRELAGQYLAKFGFKFLVSAKGKAAEELLSILHSRFDNDRDAEISNAKAALWLITLKRIHDHPLDAVLARLTKLAETHHIAGAQIAICSPFGLQCVNLGEAVKGQAAVQSSTLFVLASLSKTIASAFAIEFFAKAGISLDDRVNALFSRTKSQFRLVSKGEPVWADHVTVADLMRHSALNMHYVKGFDAGQGVPPIGEVAFNGPQFGYEPVAVISTPGTSFKYSGGGFIVLEYLIECLSEKSMHDLTDPFLKVLGLNHLTFTQKSLKGHSYADGYFDDGFVVPGGRQLFPAFAAGAMGSAEDMLAFLGHLGRAFSDLKGSGPISHDTAVTMLHGRDLGCREFMGCDMGLGVFVADMGDNRVAIHQGANEGFRAIYIYAFSGPDAGKGFVVLCNADNRGVRFVAEVAQTLLKALDVSGVDFAKFSSNFDDSKLSQEQIVNLGYKNLVFNAFRPMLPVPIHRTLPKDPLAEFNLLVDADVASVSCQKFACAENLFSPFPPEFDPELFCAQGKVMDSWETKRHNDDACDKLTLKLRHPDVVQYVSLSTKYHDGNQAQFVRLLGRGAGDTEWREFLSKTSMNGHAARYIRLDRPTGNLADVMIEMYPDGGLSRVGLYKFLPDSAQEPFKTLSHSACVRFAEEIPKTHKPLVISYKPDPDEIWRNLASSLEKDYGSAAFGAVMVKATNEHYGPAVQVISPFPAIHMFDGLESSRSRDIGHFEEVEIKLAREIQISRVVLDFKFFVNNNPRSVILFALVDGEWKDISGVVPVKAFAGNKKEIRVKEKVLSDQIRLRTLPDGGVHRIHIYET